MAEDTATRQKVMIVDISVGGSHSGGKVVPRGPLGHASVPTIAVASESWDDEVADLLGVDLARRLLENGVLHARGSWDGVLPAQVIDGIKYPATRATFTQVGGLVGWWVEGCFGGGCGRMSWRWSCRSIYAPTRTP